MRYDIADWKTQYLSLHFDSLASAKTMKTLNFMTEFFTIFQLGNCRQQLGKKRLFGIGNGALFRPQIKRKRNTVKVT